MFLKRIVTEFNQTYIRNNAVLQPRGLCCNMLAIVDIDEALVKKNYSSVTCQVHDSPTTPRWAEPHVVRGVYVTIVSQPLIKGWGDSGIACLFYSYRYKKSKLGTKGYWINYAGVLNILWQSFIVIRRFDNKLMAKKQHTISSESRSRFMHNRMIYFLFVISFSFFFWRIQISWHFSECLSWFLS